MKRKKSRVNSLLQRPAKKLFGSRMRRTLSNALSNAKKDLRKATSEDKERCWGDINTSRAANGCANEAHSKQQGLESVRKPTNRHGKISSHSCIRAQDYPVTIDKFTAIQLDPRLSNTQALADHTDLVHFDESTKMGNAVASSFITATSDDGSPSQPRRRPTRASARAARNVFRKAAESDVEEGSEDSTVNAKRRRTHSPSYESPTSSRSDEWSERMRLSKERVGSAKSDSEIDQKGGQHKFRKTYKGKEFRMKEIPNNRAGEVFKLCEERFWKDHWETGITQRNYCDQQEAFEKIALRWRAKLTYRVHRFGPTRHLDPNAQLTQEQKDNRRKNSLRRSLRKKLEAVTSRKKGGEWKEQNNKQLKELADLTELDPNEKVVVLYKKMLAMKNMQSCIPLPP
ncbi:hypothetical protein FA10DRAFT_262763 [Acaromyces ingoldii]|uniref:Uncharacterized protein n=1 Tax=Acaromyces ingoldii TaxID=215250 RepID=A0A316YBN9_9BASI|nr:hypothetical protein FA10DRAFT_262763 [Acaromyces ingoldii]PWN86966.1 hypothetical protein FA10DRAFT_262763 [Acaromyces ingoldii]